MVVQVLLEYGADVTRENLITATSRRVSDAVRRVLMRHMAKLELLNPTIHEDCRRIIEDNDCFRWYYQHCLQELETTKAVKLCNNVSVFNIFMGSVDVFSGFARNTGLVKAFYETDCKGKFPIYSALIRKRFSAEMEKQRLRHSAAKSLSDLFGFNGPSHPVVRNILIFLACPDFKFLSWNNGLIIIWRRQFVPSQWTSSQSCDLTKTWWIVLWNTSTLYSDFIFFNFTFFLHCNKSNFCWNSSFLFIVGLVQAKDLYSRIYRTEILEAR